MTSAGSEPDLPFRQSSRFIILYGLAAAGGSAAYAPFLTVLLPQRVSELAGTETVQVLSSVAFVGAVAASISNILFGWLSDRLRNRRGWIAGGLATSCALLVSMRFVESVTQLLLTIFAWQVALNMMLGPLGAWAGDCIPDHQKGALGGLLSFAPGIGALVGALVTIPGLVSADGRLLLVAALVCALILPVIMFGRPRAMPHLMEPQPPPSLRSRAGYDLPVRRMWLARLFVQIAEAALFAFLLLWLTGLDTSTSDNDVATIFTFVLISSVPLALAAGRWSDQNARPIHPLVLAAWCGAGGLLIMAFAGPGLGIAGYAIFGISAAVFLALHTAQTLRVLPDPANRGRDLGFFNLTNTVPSLIMPGLTLALIPAFGFEALFLVLGGLMAMAGLLLAAPRLR